MEMLVEVPHFRSLSLVQWIKGLGNIVNTHCNVREIRETRSTGVCGYVSLLWQWTF